MYIHITVIMKDKSIKLYMNIFYMNSKYFKVSLRIYYSKVIAEEIKG